MNDKILHHLSAKDEALLRNLERIADTLESIARIGLHLSTVLQDSTRDICSAIEGLRVDAIPVRQPARGRRRAC